MKTIFPIQIDVTNRQFTMSDDTQIDFTQIITSPQPPLEQPNLYARVAGVPIITVVFDLMVEWIREVHETVDSDRVDGETAAANGEAIEGRFHEALPELLTRLDLCVIGSGDPIQLADGIASVEELQTDVKQFIYDQQQSEPADAIAIVPIGIDVGKRLFNMSVGRMSLEAASRLSDGPAFVIIDGQSYVIHKRTVAHLKAFATTCLGVCEAPKFCAATYEQLYSVMSLYAALRVIARDNPDDVIARRSVAALKLAINSRYGAHGTHDGSDSGTPWDPDSPTGRAEEPKSLTEQVLPQLDQPVPQYMVSLGEVRLNTTSAYTGAYFKSEHIRRMLNEAIDYRDLFIYSSRDDVFNLSEVVGKVVGFTVQPDHTITMNIIPFGRDLSQLPTVLDSSAANVVKFNVAGEAQQNPGDAAPQYKCINAVFIELPTDDRDIDFDALMERRRNAIALRQGMTKHLGARSVSIVEINADGKPKFVKRF